MGLIQEEAIKAEKYKLKIEKIDYNNKKIEIAQLTSDNVARVEAMILTDSNYKNSWNSEKGIIYKKNKANQEIKYIGSSHYWLNQLKQFIDKGILEQYDYEQIIRYAIIAIDNENSTHLNSDNIGREAVTKRILNIHPDQLKEYIRTPGKNYELINIIQKPQKNNEKNHLSFATKFCHYACLCLFEGTEFEDNYSIYDNVLKQALPKYIKRYLGIDIKVKEYENQYDKYIDFIDNIRKKAESEYGEKISRNGFDHLVWYFHKGQE